MIWFVWRLSFHSPQETTISIRYFPYPSGCKDYCQIGKDFHPPVPDLCPICGARARDCLNGHGWYKRVELVTGYDKRYGPFYIYRFLCKNSGSTISMHPDFCAAYKRFLLEYVITLLEQNLVDGKSIYELCNKHSIQKQTLKRWKKGFLANEPAKRICFLPRSTAPPGIAFLKELLIFFITTGHGNAAQGAVWGLLRFYHGFSCSLY